MSAPRNTQGQVNQYVRENPNWHQTYTRTENRCQAYNTADNMPQVFTLAWNRTQRITIQQL